MKHFLLISLAFSIVFSCKSSDTINESSEASVTRYSMLEEVTALYWVSEDQKTFYRGLCGKGVWEVERPSQCQTKVVSLSIEQLKQCLSKQNFWNDVKDSEGPTINKIIAENDETIALFEQELRKLKGKDPNSKIKWASETMTVRERNERLQSYIKSIKEENAEWKHYLDIELRDLAEGTKGKYLDQFEKYLGPVMEVLAKKGKVYMNRVNDNIDGPYSNVPSVIGDIASCFP